MQDLPPWTRALAPERLRWTCDPSRFRFETTAQIEHCPIHIIGQPRALEALAFGLARRVDGYNVFVSGPVGSGRSTVVRRVLDALERSERRPSDLVYVRNFEDPDRPRLIAFAAGEGKRFRARMEELIAALRRDLPRVFVSDPYRARRAEQLERAAREQKNLLRDFEKRVHAEGFSLAQIQMGPFVRSQLVPLIAGNPVEMEQLERLVEQEKFGREEFDKLRECYNRLKGELEALSNEVREIDRRLRSALAELDHELARPVVEDAIRYARGSAEGAALEAYLAQVAADLLEHLDEFREGEEKGEGAAHGPALDWVRYAVNVIVDNSQSVDRPVIWETTPSYRNLFGTIDRHRSPAGEWETDHTRIKAGSLLRAHEGFLVLDALDVLVEPGVWAALKRTLRNRQVEIQPFDPGFPISFLSMQPEPVPIDVKVLLIGTPQIHALLHALDEDFRKIFKVKADFATETALSGEELENFACLIHKRCQDDDLPPFHRDAVAAVVEHGARLAGHRQKLTTRFSEVTDVIRETGYWARRAGATLVRAEHVDEALFHRVYRVDRVAEILRERIAEGQVLVDLEGEKVAQVNGLALLGVADHVFGYPARITATTAMGRAGIIDVEREASMSGSTHTKGVLILGGFLRECFAQDKPLTLTASLCFEQSYGGIDGDSASCAELYALLSSLSGVPLRQGIAVTGSVNQRGEVQPVGGINEKIEGFFDLCALCNLSGQQGVLIPERNTSQLMLRKDVVAAVREGRFHVWAVQDVEQGLEILSGRPAGTRDSDGRYPPQSVFGLVDARLAALAAAVRSYGRADSDL